jgi:hypothetical protein
MFVSFRLNYWKVTWRDDGIKAVRDVIAASRRAS